MRICIDSNQFIFGISGIDEASEKLITLIPYLDIVLPRLIIKEVTRNLSPNETKIFYKLLNDSIYAQIIDEPVPKELVNKYISMGLPEKADAYIGAFAEWQDIKILISDNRHFLFDLHNASFNVITPDIFLYEYFSFNA